MKPHRLIGDYLRDVDMVLDALRGDCVESYRAELLTGRRANLHLRIRVANGRLLEIDEAVVVEGEVLCHLDYRYHCQGPDHALVFRYDSTPHFPGLPGFPHHKHIPGSVLPGRRPQIAEVVAEARV